MSPLKKTGTPKNIKIEKYQGCPKDCEGCEEDRVQEELALEKLQDKRRKNSKEDK
jgi:hypothetical protein